MAATGVLPFIRGVDLSGNDFKVRGDAAPPAKQTSESVPGWKKIGLERMQGRPAQPFPLLLENGGGGPGKPLPPASSRVRESEAPDPWGQAAQSAFFRTGKPRSRSNQDFDVGAVASLGVTPGSSALPPFLGGRWPFGKELGVWVCGSRHGRSLPWGLIWDSNWIEPSPGERDRALCVPASTGKKWLDLGGQKWEGPRR